MDAIIRVESATATATVTDVVVVATINIPLGPVFYDLAPLVIASIISVGGCSVAAIPNPFYVERGVLATAA